MADTPEKKVKRKIVDILKQYGMYYFYPVTGGYGASGVFDIVSCFNGVFIGIEVKATPKNRPTKLQSRNALQAKASGGIVLLVHNENLHVLRDLLEELQNDSGKKSIGRCVWPFDGVEAGTFNYT